VIVLDNRNKGINTTMNILERADQAIATTDVFLSEAVFASNIAHKITGLRHARGKGQTAGQLIYNKFKLQFNHLPDDVFTVYRGTQIAANWKKIYDSPDHVLLWMRTDPNKINMAQGSKQPWDRDSDVVKKIKAGEPLQPELLDITYSGKPVIASQPSGRGSWKLTGKEVNRDYGIGLAPNASRKWLVGETDELVVLDLGKIKELGLDTQAMRTARSDDRQGALVDPSIPLGGKKTLEPGSTWRTKYNYPGNVFGMLTPKDIVNANHARYRQMLADKFDPVSVRQVVIDALKSVTDDLLSDISALDVNSSEGEYSLRNRIDYIDRESKRIRRSSMISDLIEKYAIYMDNLAALARKEKDGTPLEWNGYYKSNIKSAVLDIRTYARTVKANLSK